MKNNTFIFCFIFAIFMSGCTIRGNLPTLSEPESLMVKIDRPWGSLLLKNRYNELFFRGNLEITKKVIMDTIAKNNCAIIKSEDEKDYFYKKIVVSDKEIEIYIKDLGNKTVGVKINGESQLRNKFLKETIDSFKIEGDKYNSDYDVSVSVNYKRNEVIDKIREKLLVKNYIEENTYKNNVFSFHNDNLILDFNLEPIGEHETRINFIAHNKTKFKSNKEILKGIIEINKQKEFLAVLIRDLNKNINISTISSTK